LLLEAHGATFGQRVPILEQARRYWGAASIEERIKVESQGPTLPNPDAWLAGANLFLENVIDNVDATRGSFLNEVIESGRQLQAFYQSAATDERRRIDVPFVMRTLRAYQGTMEAAAKLIEAGLAKQPLPAVSLDQPLPDEIVSTADKTKQKEENQRIFAEFVPQAERPNEGKGPDLEKPPAWLITAKNFFNGELLPLPMNEWDKRPRNVRPGRGLLSNSKYSLLAAPLISCADHKFEFGHTPGISLMPAWDGWMKDRVRVIADAYWDTSVLSLIPRPALWAEKVFPAAKMTSCVSKTKVYDHISAGFDAFIFQLDIRIEITISDDIYRVAELRGEGVVGVQGGQGYSYPPVFRLMWHGGSYGNYKVKPFAGQFDKVFRPIQSNRVTEDMAALRDKIRGQVVTLKKNIRDELMTGEAAQKIRDAEQIRRTLLSLLSLGLPSSSAISNRMVTELKSDIKLLKPEHLLPLNAATSQDELPTMLRYGITANQISDTLNFQLRNLYRVLEAASKADPVDRVSTPVDETLANLVLLQDEAQKVSAKPQSNQ